MLENVELKREDETMQQPNNSNKENLLPEVLKKLDSPEESKSSIIVNDHNSSAEDNLLKQTTFAHIENETKTEHKVSAETVKVVKLLSLPYSPTLLNRDKKFSGDKSPFIKNQKLLELTKFDLNGISQENQVIKTSLPEKSRQTIGNAHRINDVALKLKENLFGD